MEEVTRHVNESDDIHDFLDGVVNYIYQYNEAFVKASEEREISFNSHKQLSKLRKELFSDIANIEKMHKLPVKEKGLLSKLM